MSCGDFNVVYPPKSDTLSSLSTNKMISALSAIAQEMQKFDAGTSISCHNFHDSRLLSDKLKIFKSNLQLKKKQIKYLRDNLRKACIVAKTAMSVNENVTLSFHNDMNSARSECAYLIETNKVNSETNHLLKSENQALHTKIHHLNEFIELGYKELQKIRNGPVKDVPTVMQLKEIILSCGQYYADYCNEQETRVQIEQKNRFLNNKISILNTNLEAIAEELKIVRFENVKLRKENNILRTKNVKENETTAYTHCNKRIFQSNDEKTKVNKSLNTMNKGHTCDLKSHLALVENLLCDQDVMIKDLLRLSELVKSSGLTYSATETNSI